MKPIWKSKTFWFNLLAAGAAIAQGQPLHEVVPPELLAAVVAGINIALRLITEEPVTV